MHPPDAEAESAAADATKPRDVLVKSAWSISPLLLVVGLLLIPACERDPAAKPTVVLYCSADDAVARPIIELFEKETGIDVRTVTDTEATKTTGLVTRLRAARDRPSADVFWASEPLQLLQLEAEGIVEAVRGNPGDPVVHGAPVAAPLRQFALRARVLVFNPKLVTIDETPLTMHDLIDPRWKGRLVMARPAFGTTCTHMMVLDEIWGKHQADRWRSAMASNEVRYVDGNSAVVRAVALGEAAAGLTDTDDVWAGQDLGWAIDFVYIDNERPRMANSPAGVLLIPNAVAWVRAGPNDADATKLIEFLVSERVERMLAEGPGRHIPTHPALTKEFADRLVPNTLPINFNAMIRPVPAHAPGEPP